MDLKLVCAGKYLSVFERHIRHLKDSVRGMYQLLSFDEKKNLPARIIIELLDARTFY